MLCVQDSNLGRKVLSEVKKYDQLLKTKLGNDKFVTVGVQTRDNGAVLRKLKEAQTNNAQHKDSFTQWETLLEEAQPAEAPKADMQRLPTSALLQDANCKVSTPCMTWASKQPPFHGHRPRAEAAVVFLTVAVCFR